jgi:DNA-binding transcriptional LysR family regulator
MGQENGFRRGQLRCFVTVADEGQLTSAAKKLYMAQPAVTQAIAQLESELGLQLFDRHPRGVSLTPAGARFYEPASRAVAALAEATRTAQALARAESGTIVFGFLGAPPALDSPGTMAAFTSAHPNIDIRYRELAFPSAPTSSWLAGVDLVACHAPAPDPAVWSETLRREPRTVIAPAAHRLAAVEQLAVDEILDETFVGFHPAVDPAWAGFWSLDDVRGGAPAKVTDDRALNPQEVIAALPTREAITTVPASVAALLVSVVPGIVAIALRGAPSSAINLAGHADMSNPLVSTLRRFALDRRDLEQAARR